MTIRANAFFFYFVLGFVFALLLIGSFALGVLTALYRPDIFLKFEAPKAAQIAPEAVSSDTIELTLRSVQSDTSKPSDVALNPDEKFAKEFEVVLNQFLKDLSAETVSYKRDRRILKEVISPYNLEGTENAEKSYKAFKDDIAPTLRQKGQKIIDVFQKSDVAVVSLLKDKPEDVREKLLSTWGGVKKEQLNGVIDFLANEERLIAAHEKLLKFYFVHSKLYSVDPEAGAVVFKNQKYQEEEKRLLDEIENIRDYGKKED
ncbi:MAG: hypothetical protein IPH06_03335 [Alphaproteobacteria bacterium]|jgi:hypothetical protein|nr:hypothetical protein [Alphaproteobacteria bacterium]QQS57072.1 MAG: hypothetical protein IPN28_12585 [Alphaproteobacteria bacterium]